MGSNIAGASRDTNCDSRWPFSKPKKRTPAEVAGFLGDFLNHTGAKFDWDDFTSVPIADPELDSLRREADMLALPLTPEGKIRLQTLFARAEKLTSAWLEAGRPE